MKTIFLIILIIIGLVGCSSSSTVSANYLLTDATKNIEILTEDNHIIKLSAGEYIVKQYKDSSVVIGDGVIKTSGEKIEKKYSGSINFSDITYVEIFTESKIQSIISTTAIVVSITVIIIYLTSIDFST